MCSSVGTVRVFVCMYVCLCLRFGISWFYRGWCVGQNFFSQKLRYLDWNLRFKDNKRHRTGDLTSISLNRRVRGWAAAIYQLKAFALDDDRNQ